MRDRYSEAEQARLNILDIAAQEFADKGLAGARVDEIADKINSSKRMIYYYFGGKEELYRAVLEQAYAKIRTREAAANYEAMRADEALKQVVSSPGLDLMEHGLARELLAGAKANIGGPVPEVGLP